MTKTHDRENFPVASLILAKDVRAQVLDFYQFARAADDIADSPDLLRDEKLEKLKEDTSDPFKDGLLKAFRQDCVKNRYQTWEELMEYCQYSANPVGRFLLHVHGEEEGYEAADHLCTALQILNHLQDCQKDFHQLDRIYLPKEFLKDGSNYEDLLNQNHSHADLRSVLDQCLERTHELIKKAALLAGQIKNKRLRYQAKVTWLCAMALYGRLTKNDPLARRVELGKLDKLLIAYRGFYPL